MENPVPSAPLLEVATRLRTLAHHLSGGELPGTILALRREAHVLRAVALVREWSETADQEVLAIADALQAGGDPTGHREALEAIADRMIQHFAASQR